MPTQLPGIRNHIKELEEIAAQCGEKPVREVPKDQFLVLKTRMYEMLEEVLVNVKERGQVIKRRGNCQESIQKGHKIRTDLDELKRSLPKLQALHKKAMSKRSASKNEELQGRYQDIRLLKRRIDEANEIFINANVGDIPDDLGLALGLDGKPTIFGNSGIEGGRQREARDMTDEERAALSHIKARDHALDKQLDQIGQVLDRMNPVAQEIGRAAQRHRDKADSINVDVEQADKELKAMNKKMSEIMKYERNTTCCCQLILGIVLLCCVSFIFAQMR